MQPVIICCDMEPLYLPSSDILKIVGNVIIIFKIFTHGKGNVAYLTSSF